MNSVDEIQQVGKRPKRTSPGRVRWWIVWTLFFSTVINYISRQTFSVLAPMISAQYHLSHTDLSKIFGAFQVSYAITWLIGGIFLDAVGTRLGLALAVVFWSIVNILTGFASSVFGFASFRFLLGIGEGLNWPGASKTVAEWFPSQERSLSVAIFDSGSSVGGAVAALSIPLIAIKFGWQAAFVVTGMLGFIWLLMWLRVYHTLDRHPRVTPAEVAYIRAGQEVPDASPRAWPEALAQALRAAECMGHRSGPCAYRSHLVVLCVLAASIPERCARIQPAKDCPFCLDAVCRRRSWQLHRWPDLRILHSSRHSRGARTPLGMRLQLPADTSRHSRSQRTQRLCRAGVDLFCSLGLCELVHHGSHAAF